MELANNGAEVRHASGQTPIALAYVAIILSVFVLRTRGSQIPDYRIEGFA